MEDRKINLILPSPPGVNNLYFTRIVSGKYPGQKAYPIRVLSDEGKAYKETVAEVAEGFTPFIGDVWVIFRWYRPRRVGDLDGIFKIVLDGMTGHVYLDDKQVKRIWSDVYEDRDHPRVEIEVKPLGLC